MSATADIYAAFAGQEATVAAVARYMRQHGLSPDDVLAACDEWMAARMAEMKPVKRVASGEWRVARAATRNAKPATRNQKRHRAGDHAMLPRACPRCGGDAELYQLCHISSPVWRTQLACMADGCAWHGKSKLPIDALLAAGAANIKHNVIEG